MCGNFYGPNTAPMFDHRYLCPALPQKEVGIVQACALHQRRFIDIAHNLSASKLSGDYAEFARHCRYARLTKEYAGVPASQFYWDRMTGHRSTIPIREARENTDLSFILGILLEGADPLCNTLLYDLFEAMFSGYGGFQAEVFENEQEPTPQKWHVNVCIRLLGDQFKNRF